MFNGIHSILFFCYNFLWSQIANNHCSNQIIQFSLFKNEKKKKRLKKNNKMDVFVWNKFGIFYNICLSFIFFLSSISFWVFFLWVKFAAYHHHHHHHHELHHIQIYIHSKQPKINSKGEKSSLCIAIYYQIQWTVYYEIKCVHFLFFFRVQQQTNQNMSEWIYLFRIIPKNEQLKMK